ncbi:hypothetical protein TSAR_014216 [Trichomalopsis sarcophagae]|uniref:Endonuclease/exonuclease/phosphatase domain-containing protein n=1 Tax=Trichomalopsis sarcophagae TaxID=543379 RepID=A0A232FLI1_9HYME|nr:hypothetical protein TSAR_014216 [Trichomalopsis sarcophagae]
MFDTGLVLSWVRWRDGNKAHEFSTAADLNAIAATYESMEKQVTVQNHDNAKGLKAGFLNACSLKGHIHDFRQYLLDDPSYDVFGVAETRLGPMIDRSLVVVRGYSLSTQDRNERGGSVALYIRDALTFTELAHSNTASPVKPMETEYLMGYIRGGKLDPIFVYVVYRPPGVAFTPSFLNDSKVLCADYSSKIITGDFNANLLSTSKDAGFLFDLAGELDLKIIDHGSTNFTTQPDKLIDTLENNGNVWKDLRNLGLLSRSASGLHGFSLDGLNRHFAGVSCSSSESMEDALHTIQSVPVEVLEQLVHDQIVEFVVCKGVLDPLQTGF